MQFAFELSAPAVIDLTVPGFAPATIDVYEARRVLEAANNSPTEDAKWGKVLDWLAQKMGVARDRLAENMALEFNDAVAAIVARLNEERKKKVASIACSPDSIPASPATTEAGP